MMNKYGFISLSADKQEIFLESFSLSVTDKNRRRETDV